METLPQSQPRGNLQGDHAAPSAPEQSMETAGAADSHQRESVHQERRTMAMVFAAVMRDRRISRGAFHLFHCIYDYRNPKTGKCFPGQRLICKDIGADPHSIRQWIAELRDAGWLSVETVIMKVRGKRKGEVRTVEGFSPPYTLMDGTGQVLGKPATTHVGKTHNTRRRWEKPQRSVGSGTNEVLRTTTTEVTPPISGGELKEGIERKESIEGKAKPADVGALPLGGSAESSATVEDGISKPWGPAID